MVGKIGTKMSNSAISLNLTKQNDLVYSTSNGEGSNSRLNNRPMLNIGNLESPNKD